MSKSPLFRISDLKSLKKKELGQAVKEQKRGRDDDPEQHGDKYLGEYQEPSKSSRSNISKISKSRVDQGTKLSRKNKGFKNIQDEDNIMEDTSLPAQNEFK